MHAVAGARRALNRTTALLAVAAVVLTAGLVAATPAQAYNANDYPSWTDVLAARNNEKAKTAEITRLENLLTQLQKNVDDTAAASLAKVDAYMTLQMRFDEAALKAQELQTQADTAAATAEESKKQAGQLAARMSRVGGGDLTATLIFSDTATDKILGQLGMAAKMSEQSNAVFSKAKQDENLAQSLSDQAAVAQDALAELAAQAEVAMVEAQAAADAAEAALAEQSGNKARLQAQLATLKENRIATEAEYADGQAAAAAAKAAAEAAAKAAAEAAAKAAAEAAAKAAEEAAKNGTPPPPPPAAWVRPSSGWVSSSYGYRVPPVSGVSSFHSGTDLSVGCYNPIYATHSGRVTFAAYSSSLGNYVRIDHGDGTSSGYAHIASGGILVHVGQNVAAGQYIAKVGSTGAATGCHLHFEIRVGGVTTDPVPFMAARGVYL